MDIRLPQEFLQKLQLESPDLPKPLTRMSRRASLVSPKRVRGHQNGHPLPCMVLDLPVPAEACSSFLGLWRHLLAREDSYSRSSFVNLHSLVGSHQ